MTIESALSFFLAIFIFGITPGPGVFAILARSLATGTGRCFFLALGMVVSDIIYLVLACYGLAALADHWSGVFTLVRVAGALYLTYLGLQMWRATDRHDAQREEASQKNRRLSFLQGFLISASNPKVILFYIAFLPTFIDLKALTQGDIALAALLTLFALLAGLMLIAAGAENPQPFGRVADDRCRRLSLFQQLSRAAKPARRGK